MSRWRFLFGVLGISLLTSCAALITPDLQQDLGEIKPGNYELDPAHTAVLFKVDHMGFSRFIGRFNRVEASLQYNDNDILKSRLQARVHMDSIDVNNPDFEASLKSHWWFDVEKYPFAEFVTENAEYLDDGKIRFFGGLTFRGITAPIFVDVTVNGAANNLVTGRYTLGFSAKAEFSRSEFGLDNYIPAVGDTVALEIEAEFQRRKKRDADES